MEYFAPLFNYSVMNLSITKDMNPAFQVIAYRSILDRLANQKGDVAMFGKHEMYDSITGMYYVGEKVLQTVFDCTHGDFRLVQKAYSEMKASLEYLITGYALALHRSNECQYENEYGFDIGSDVFDEDLAQSMCLARKYLHNAKIHETVTLRNIFS